MSTISDCYRVIFVNGLRNEKCHAEEHASRLSVGRITVEPKYNPGIWSAGETVPALVNRIWEIIEMGQNLLLILHSHGAFVGYQALDSMRPACDWYLKNFVTVITCGGATLIPDTFAKVVKNYQHVDDMISGGGLKIFGNWFDTAYANNPQLAAANGITVHHLKHCVSDPHEFQAAYLSSAINEKLNFEKLMIAEEERSKPWIVKAFAKLKQKIKNFFSSNSRNQYAQM